MVSLTQNRWVTGTLLAAYFLATSCASLVHGLVHHHGSQSHACGHTVHAVADHDGCDVHGECDEQAVAEAAERDYGVCFVPNTGESSDDACVVCRFLGLSSLPVALAAPACSGELVAAVRVIEPPHVAGTFRLALRSRAPPAMA